MKKIVALLIGLGLAFAAGFVPQYLQVQELEQELASVREDLGMRLATAEERYRLSQLHSQAGMLLVEVQQQNFGEARKRSTVLFNDLSAVAAATADDQVKASLTKLLGQRDAITSELAIGSPEVSAKVRDLYLAVGNAGGVK